MYDINRKAWILVVRIIVTIGSAMLRLLLDEGNCNHGVAKHVGHDATD